jgi:hypothetical protein
MNNRLKHLEDINDQIKTEQFKILNELTLTNLDDKQRGMIHEFIKLSAQKSDNLFEMMECVASEKARVDKVLHELPLLVFHVPLSTPMPTKKKPNKKYYLNLNHLRSAPKWDYNKAKTSFSKIVKETLDNYGFEFDKPIDKVKIIAKIFKKTKRECDPDNYCVVNKFTLDALVSYGFLKEDNFNYVGSAEVQWGGFSDRDFAEITVFNN